MIWRTNRVGYMKKRIIAIALCIAALVTFAVAAAACEEEKTTAQLLEERVSDRQTALYTGQTENAYVTIGTLDREKVVLIRAFVNRLSLGVQSFCPETRETLGRNCSQQKLDEALELVCNADFPHWNCDLIYAIPGQNREAWRQELRRAASCGIDHLSCYNLTPEEGALLSSQLIPDEEDSAAMWEIAETELAAAGIRRYEISNYARPGSECRHNRNVWRGGLLKGFGPAAASFDGRKRSIQPESIRSWLRRSVPEFDEIPLGDRLNEIFVINLRTTGGWTPKLWKTVPEADSWHRRVEAARKAASKTSAAFFEISSHRIRLTEEGMLFWNTVAENII